MMINDTLSMHGVNREPSISTNFQCRQRFPKTFNNENATQVSQSCFFLQENLSLQKNGASQIVEKKKLENRLFPRKSLVM